MKVLKRTRISPFGGLNFVIEQLDQLGIGDLLKKELPELEKGVVPDYDNTLIYNKKSDSLMTYKKQFGYAPGVGIIGHNIVYVENRNGNSAAANLQDETLERMFSLLKEENIKVDCFRADAASYRRLTLKTIVGNSNKFYIYVHLPNG